MFRRRQQPPLYSRLRHALWPRRGFARQARYIAYRVVRLPGSAHAIAAGFASGAAASFTPLVGLHFLFAALLAVALRASVIASAIGTVVGNPWTFPLIWALLHRVGTWMGAGPADSDFDLFAFIDVFAGLMAALMRFDSRYITDVVWPVVWPMLVGSIPVGVAVWFGTYWLVKRAVIRYQNSRVRRRVLRIRRAALGAETPPEEPS